MHRSIYNTDKRSHKKLVIIGIINHKIYGSNIEDNSFDTKAELDTSLQTTRRTKINPLKEEEKKI